MSIFYVLDTTNRDVAAYVANITMIESGELIVRQAITIGDAWSLSKAAEYNQGRLEFPLLIIGDGYQAKSSEGFVSINFGLDCGKKQFLSTTVIGFLPFEGPLRRVKKMARIMKVASIATPKTFTNSNPGSTAAARAGIDILLRFNRKSVLIAEGQSDNLRAVQVFPNWEDQTTFIIDVEYGKMFNPTRVGLDMAGEEPANPNIW